MKRWPLQLGVEPYYVDEASMVLHGSCFDVPVPMVDVVICDTPFSEETHRGHDASADRTRRTRRGRIEPMRARPRRALNYDFWTPDDVNRYVELWSPRCRGWFVIMTDDVLVPTWKAAFRDVGRYPFASIPFVWPGSRFRKCGDGPACCTIWIVVARPRHAPYSKWSKHHHAPASEYRMPAGLNDQVKKMGGKPVWLLERLVDDYSLPGNLIIDPTAGHGTTGVAAKRLGRRSILVDVNEADVRECASRLAVTREQRVLKFDTATVTMQQTSVPILTADAE